MEGKKLALVAVVVAMMFTSSLAQLASDVEENENENIIELVSDGSKDRVASYEKDNSPRKMMKAATPSPAPPPGPTCWGDFCGAGLLQCDEPCFCFIPTGQTRGSCLLF